MSMNIHLHASTNAVINTKKPKTQVIFEHFDCWQTPTEITDLILKSENKFETYKAWVLSISKDEEVFIYSYDDPFEEKEPIDIQIYNYGREHIKELTSFLEEHKDWDKITWCTF